eukprot:8926225-Lingulodinium_polyedra.AAC.1
MSPPVAPSKCKSCKLCRAKSTDPSPFPDAVSVDCFGGLWPRMRYTKSQSCPQHKWTCGQL